MKHKLNLLLLGACFFVLLTSMKTPNPLADTPSLKVEITTLEDLRVQLTALNLTGKDLHINVFMRETSLYSRLIETEIYQEEISSEIPSFNRTLNLSKLESGSYRIKVRAGKQHFERVLEIQAKPVMPAELPREISIR